MYQTYKVSTLNGDKIVVLRRNDDGGVTAFLADDDNPISERYQAWLAEGNEPEEWAPEEVSE